jgi:hypothetical protein
MGMAPHHPGRTESGPLAFFQQFGLDPFEPDGHCYSDLSEFSAVVVTRGHAQFRPCHLCGRWVFSGHPQFETHGRWRVALACDPGALAGRLGRLVVGGIAGVDHDPQVGHRPRHDFTWTGRVGLVDGTDVARKLWRGRGLECQPCGRTGPLGSELGLPVADVWPDCGLYRGGHTVALGLCADPHGAPVECSSRQRRTGRLSGIQPPCDSLWGFFVGGLHRWGCSTQNARAVTFCSPSWGAAHCCWGP